MDRRLLVALDQRLQLKLGRPRLTFTFGRYFSLALPMVLALAVSVAAVGLLMLWLGWAAAGPVLLTALWLVFGFILLGILGLSLLPFLDVGWTATEVALDSVREARGVRRQRARPEAGQLTFLEVEGGALSPVEASGGGVSMVGADLGEA